MKVLLLLAMPGGGLLLFSIALLVLTVYALMDVVSNIKDFAAKMVWLLIVLFFPLIGAVVYFRFGKKYQTIN